MIAFFIQPESLRLKTIFIDPFTQNVWIILFVSIFIISFSVFFLDFKLNINPGKERIFSRIYKIITHVFGIITFQGMNIKYSKLNIA